MSPADLPPEGVELKLGLVAKHDLFPVNNFPVAILVGEGNPSLHHSLCENWLVSHLPGGESKGLFS